MSYGSISKLLCTFSTLRKQALISGLHLPLPLSSFATSCVRALPSVGHRHRATDWCVWAVFLTRSELSHDTPMVPAEFHLHLPVPFASGFLWTVQSCGLPVCTHRPLEYSTEGRTYSLPICIHLTFKASCTNGSGWIYFSALTKTDRKASCQAVVFTTQICQFNQTFQCVQSKNLS